MLTSDTALVIGNGESRSNLNLKTLQGKACLIGCNAIHRDLLVNHLICCDRRMVFEVLGRKKSRKIPFIYTREKFYRDFNELRDNDRVKLLPVLPYQGTNKIDDPEHWGSGPYAILLAATLQYKNVYILGFDLWGDIDYKLNNVYKGTNNYNKPTSNAVDPSYWIYQIRKVFQYFPETQFYIFNKLDWKKPTEWELPNVHFEDLQKFKLEVDL